MADFVKVCKVGDIEPGQGQSFTVGESLVGVFNVDGEFFAINDLCPHMGASLSAGHVEGDTVFCPWHAWRFCVKDGTWCDNRKLSVDAYEVKVEDGEVFVSSEPKSDDDKATDDTV